MPYGQVAPMGAHTSGALLKQLEMSIGAACGMISLASQMGQKITNC
jgi:hypothetical protein